MRLLGLHHVAIICSNYTVSRDFYTRILALPIVAEEFRAQRNSHKLDLALPDGAQLELFSFPSPPKRLTHPEACGLRHLALRVENVEQAVASLAASGVTTEPIRIDAATGRKFTFFADPDGLPIELYEA